MKRPPIYVLEYRPLGTLPWVPHSHTRHTSLREASREQRYYVKCGFNAPTRIVRRVITETVVWPRKTRKAKRGTR